MDIRHLHGNAKFCSKECWRKNYAARPGVKERHAAALRRWLKRKAEREAQQAEGAETGEALVEFGLQVERGRLTPCERATDGC